MVLKVARVNERKPRSMWGRHPGCSSVHGLVRRRRTCKGNRRSSQQHRRPGRVQ